jgi:hypothetical protein
MKKADGFPVGLFVCPAKLDPGLLRYGIPLTIDGPIHRVNQTGIRFHI